MHCTELFNRRFCQNITHYLKGFLHFPSSTGAILRYDFLIELSPTSSLTSRARTSTNGPQSHDVQNHKTSSKIIEKMHNESFKIIADKLDNEIVIARRIERNGRPTSTNTWKNHRRNIHQQPQPQQPLTIRQKEHRHPTSHWRATSQHRREGAQQQQGEDSINGMEFGKTIDKNHPNQHRSGRMKRYER